MVRPKHNICPVYNGTETISFRGPKARGIVPKYIRNSKSLKKIKSRIRNLPPPEGCECRLYIVGLEIKCANSKKSKIEIFASLEELYAFFHFLKTPSAER